MGSNASMPQRPSKVAVTDNSPSMPETEQPLATNAPSLPATSNTSESNTSFLSSMLSAAGSVLRGSSKSLDHKRSFSDGSFYVSNKHDLDDIVSRVNEDESNSERGSDKPQVKNVVIEPIRPAAIDTIGKGELSLESLGLAPIQQSPTHNSGTHSRYSFPMAATQSQDLVSNSIPLSSDILDSPNPATKPSRGTISDLPGYRDVNDPVNDVHFDSIVPELIVQQPEPTTLPEIDFSSSKKSPVNITVTTPAHQHSSVGTRANTFSPGSSNTLSPHQNQTDPRHNSFSSVIPNRRRSSSSIAPDPSGGISSVLAASALSFAGAPVQLPTAPSHGLEKPQRSITDRDRSPSTFLRSPANSLREKRRYSFGRDRRDASPLRLDKTDDEDIDNNPIKPLHSPDIAIASQEHATKAKHSSHLVGFAYANNKRNHEFHRLFRSLSPNDYLLDDFSCALSKEILVQGRMYVSEHNICFNSNILGWVTTLVIGFDEVVGLEKKMTAGLFPNAITVQTLHNRYSFASFISRDSVYEFLMSIWKQASSRAEVGGDNDESDVGISELDDEEDDDDDDDDEQEEGYGSSDNESSGYDGNSDFDLDSEVSSISSDIDSEAEFGETARHARATRNNSSNAKNSKSGSGDSDNNKGKGSNGASTNDDDATKWPVNNLGPDTHGATEPSFDLEKSDEKLLIKDTINAPLGVVANLLFGNDVTFITRFNEDNQKNFDLKQFGAFNALEESGFRQYEFIKPINGSVGPKQTKCICTDTIKEWDLESCISVITSTKTPDVPSGNSFVTLTRYTLWWGSNNSTILQLSYRMEWSARSFLKGPIEKGTQDGQSSFAKALVEELNSSISKSRSKGSLSKTKTKPGKSKPGRKKKGSKTATSSGDLNKDSSQNNTKSLSENGGTAGGVIGGILGLILDILTSMPFDYVPIPLGGLIIVAVFLIWLFWRLFGGASYSSDVDSFTDIELAKLFMDSNYGSSAALGFGNAAAIAAAYARSGGHRHDLIFGDGSSRSKRNIKNKNKPSKLSILSNAYTDKIAQVRLEEEYILWSWIEDRTRFLSHERTKPGLGNGISNDGNYFKREENPSGSPYNEPVKDGSSTAKDTNNDGTLNIDKGGIRDQYYVQNLKEAVRLTELRLELLKKKFSLD